MTAAAVLAHLWQSTLVASALALLTLTVRRAPAGTRYAIWFAASLKFLIPFAALASLGALFEWREALPATSEWTVMVDAVSRLPFAPSPDVVPVYRVTAGTGIDITTAAAVIWMLGCATVLGVWLLRWRRVSHTVRAAAPSASGAVHETIEQLDPSIALPVVSSDTSLEPGVFGIVRPVLLWPRDIESRLDHDQVRAILEHELAHVRRRDNLTAAAHMVVEAIFWFHPLVWWIGARLVDERERACDEEVVRRGGDPHVYAESILKTCQFYIESPLSCMPGVTGSDLKTRIERIMADRPLPRGRRWHRTLLPITATMLLATPVIVGALSAPVLPSLRETSAGNTSSFDVATVRPNATGAMRVTMRVLTGGRWEATNVTLESMIRMSYGVQESQLIGGPAWIYSDRFDIVASSAGATTADFTLRMQSLLADRFNLKVHNEVRDLPIHALVIASRDGRLGPRLMPAAVDCTALASQRRGGAPAVPLVPGERPMCGTFVGMGRLSGGGVTLTQMASTLSQYTGRTVLDRTGLAGSFDYDVEFAADPALRGRGPGGGLPPGPARGQMNQPGARGVSIFSAVEEQLGLRLDSTRGPVGVVVIDSADRPTPGEN